MSQTPVMADGLSDGSPAATPEPASGRSPASADRWRGWLVRLYWLWPALAAAVVLRYRIGYAPLWRDELATWSAASRPLDQLIRLTEHIDASSAPYYLFMHGWIRVFGDSPIALRESSALFMVGTTALVTVLGRRLYSTATGLAAGSLFVLIPMVSRYGQEARSYAAATFFATLATLLLVRALERPGRARWTGYAAALVGVGLTHLLSLLILAGHAVIVAVIWRRDRRPEALWWLAAVTGVGAILAWPVALAESQRGNQLDWVGLVEFDTLVTNVGEVFGSAPVAGAVILLALLGAVMGGRWGGLLGVTVLASFVLLYIGGSIVPLWVARYLNFTVPLFCVLAGAALVSLPLAGARRLTAIVLSLAMVALLGNQDQWQLRRTHEGHGDWTEDYRAAAQIIDRFDQPGDGIVYAERQGWHFLDIGIDYYLHNPGPKDVLRAQDAVSRGSYWATECTMPTACVKGTNRLWTFTFNPEVLRDLSPGAATVVGNEFTWRRNWKVRGFYVSLYTRNGT